MKGRGSALTFVGIVILAIMVLAAVGCGGKATTTTAAPATTTTAAPTTTTTAATTTTAKPTTTTAKPTTTTAKPTTTTTAVVIVKIDESKAGSIVRVAPKYIVELILKGNPSTGYAWKNLSFDTKTLTLLTPEPKFVADSSASGSPGKYTWKFEAKALGGGTLKIDYVSPGGSADDSFTVDIMVEPGK
jgi:predicted secreted protein